MNHTPASGQSSLAEDDDDISLTSTADEWHESDKEFEVEDVLAERVNDEGEMEYLIQWTGFPMAQCNYEPDNNLGSELREMWEDKKKRQEKGLEPKFDITVFENALVEADREKVERHRRRNAKRKRQGKALTEPISPSLIASDKKSESNHSSDEALEEDIIQDDVPTRLSRAAQVPQQKVFKGITGSNTAKNVSAQTNSSEIIGLNHHTSGDKTATKRAPATARAKSSTQPAPRKRREDSGYGTGYQGTARKPSISAPVNKNPGLLPKPVGTPRGTIQNNPIAAKPSTGFTARKSGSAMTSRKNGPVNTTVVGNAFVDGKKRKPRKDFAAAISDPSKDQKIFDKLRYRNLAGKKEREKGDRAPAATDIPGKLFPISQGPDRQNSTKHRLMAPGTLEPTSLATHSTVIPATEETENRPPKKKLKSVRFIEEDDGALVHEPMEIDSPVGNHLLNEAGHSSRYEEPVLETSTGQLRPCATAKRLSSTDYQTRNLTQNVAKRAVFGLSTGYQLVINFDGIPRETTQSWVADFQSQGILDFSHICFAETFTAQLASFQNETLCNGSIVSDKDEPALEVVAEYLKMVASGLYFSHPAFNILIYPSRCDEWKAERLGIEPSSPSSVSLKYMIFSTVFDCGPFLTPRDSAPIRLDAISAGISAREGLMQSFFRVMPQDYHQLLPEAALGPKVQGASHSFYLALPPTKHETLRQIGLWLRARDPNCQIFAANVAGSWTAFLENTVAKKSTGTVIIHESAAWTIRRFPNLLKLLKNSLDYNFWYWGQSIHTPSLFPSRFPPTTSTIPGRTNLIRLFDYGTAILVTPSFLVSEPRHAFELFDWFARVRESKGRMKLVTAWNIREYLQDLATEKAREWEELEQTPIPVFKREVQANLKGISPQDCEFRHMAWLSVSNLVSVREAGDPWSIYDETSPVIYADQSIDPNDEQSLVNWFGWWTNMRLDQYRNFHVIGSSITTKNKGSEKAKRIVRIPTYAHGTSPDPDAAFNRIGNHLDPGKPIQPNKPGAATQTKNKEVNEQIYLPSLFNSRIFNDDNWQTMTNFLMSLPKHKILKCYGFPVFWKDSDEAYRYGDLWAKQRIVKEWFDYSWAFTSPDLDYRTYIGFFYTVVDGWDPEKAPPGRKPKRHPWLAIYRPVNPYKKPFTRTEVIIWDIAAKEKFSSTSHPRECDLLEAQQEVIRTIRSHGHEKNKGTYLAQVWLGGFVYPGTLESDMDVTVDFLEIMSGDIKGHLPAPEVQLPKSGFKRVVMVNEMASDSSSVTTANGETGENHDEAIHAGSHNLGRLHAASPEDKSTRIIFHPPRRIPGREDPPVPSKCGNHLYNEARLAKVIDKHAQTMEYEYRPTVHWYNEQKSEDRGYEHINVDTWEVIFNTFQIRSSNLGGQES